MLAVYLAKTNTESILPFKHSTRLGIALAGLSIIIACAFLINEHTLFPYWVALLPTSGAVLIILANAQLRNWGGLVAIGLISYSLYLWHWVIISYFHIYLGKSPNAIALLLAIALSFVLAFLTTKYIEPLRHSKSKYTAASLILGSVLIGTGGKLINDTEGIPNRDSLNYLSQYNIEFKRTPSRDEECNTYVTSHLQEERKFEYCRTNIHPGTQKLIVITGDSHAHTLFPGISDVAIQYGYNTVLLANSSCPPLLGFMWGKHEKQIAHCQNRIRQILAILERDPRIEKVVIATRGPTYIHGEVKGKFSVASVTTSLNTNETPDRLTYETYFNGFENSLAKISGIHHIKNIYYYLENPELDFLPRDVIPRPFDYWGLSEHNSTISRKLYQLRMEKYRKLTLNKTAMFPKATVVDVEPYLCKKDRCFTYKEKVSLYADDDHFSVSGSHYIANSTEHIVFR